MLAPGDSFQSTGRFLIGRRLGSGGMGAVYEAYDRERQETVALKTLRWQDPAALYRFKKEFRVLSDVAHPNLASLYELVAEGDDWFYTMELVDGVDFLTHVRPELRGRPPGERRSGAHPPQPSDVPRLRTAFGQLVDGVAALHHAGIVHRDLKPSNVLVTGAGRVVILDFGLADIVAPVARLQTREDGVWGTAEYMAPEQVDGQRGPANDWYAAGVMLYEALTIQLPFEGNSLKVLADKSREDPPRASKLVRGLPEDLVELCHALMARDPAARPEDSEIVRRVGGSAPATSVAGAPQPSRPGLLIGREQSLAQLREAFDTVCSGQAVTLYVQGPSGIGKTTLVRHFVETIEREAAVLLLSGRCYERESVPYKALDGVVDTLSHYLKTLPGPQVSALLPEGVSALTRLFPILLRIEAVGERRSGSREREPSDPLELRRRGFACLRELLTRLSLRQRVLVFIDDLQWADPDSVVLLEDLLRPPQAPPLLLIACFRSEDLDSLPFLRALLSQAGAVRCRTCEIGPLTSAETLRLAEELLASRAGEAARHATTIVREAAGSPFLVEQLVRYVLDSAVSTGATGVGLAETLEARMRALPEGARPLLATLAVAGRPVDARVARKAAGLEGDRRPLVEGLLKAHFVRSSGSPSRLELYHDRMRETMVAGLPPRAVAAIHLRLAQCSEELGLDDPEALFEDYVAAGVHDRAAVYATRAADKAFAALAFDRAALLYRRALELPRARPAEVTALQAKLGDALASAGRCPAAAEAYLEAAASSAPADVLEYKRRAAEQLLISGHLQAGLDVIRTVLQSVGLKLAATPRRALLSLLYRRAALRFRGLGFHERSASEVAAHELTRMDACWAVAVGLALVDNIRAADFQARHLLLALRSGEPHRIARGLAIEAGSTATRGRPGRQRAAVLLAAARDIAERIHSEHALALCELMSGIAEYHEGRWESGRRFAERAEQMLLECGGVPWELSTAQLYQAYACYFLGDIRELTRRSRVFFDRARERGNLFAGYIFRSGFSNLTWLAADDVAGAERALEEAVREWQQEEFGIPHYLAMLARCNIQLYRGRPDRAWEIVTGAWPGLARSVLLRIQGIRINTRDLHARCALAASGGSAAPLVAAAARDMRLLEAERLPWSDALSLLLRAQLAAARGEETVVPALLEQAIAAFEATHMALHANVARRRLGEACEDRDAGRVLVARVDGWMREQGIHNPACLTQVLAPGLAPPTG
ncbi:MAG TPA: AAA family ATPase [Gemmatimonadales bacterium]|nr:AAA family ATPase [Gemmatimonadales bacterium]